MDLFDLYASLTLDTTKYESGIDGATKSTEQFKEKVDDTKDPIDEVGKKSEETSNGGLTTFKLILADLASNVINDAINACKELASSVVETGIETETAFAQLETISGSDKIDMLTDSLMDLSTQTGISSADLAITAYNAISAGSSAEEAAEMVETAAKLATAGFTDTDSALSVLSTTINAYGMEASEASSISDSLIQVQNLGVTTIDQLASSMGKAISTASAYNVDLTNLESAYVSLTKSGISTEESTTYLSSMLNELGDSGSTVAGILQEQTGESFGQMMEEGYTLADALGILMDSVDGDSEALMNLWSSAEAGKASNAIVSQGLEEFNDNLLKISDSAGATEDAYETMTDTLGWKTEQLKTIGENMMLSFYDGIEGQLSSVVSWASEAGMEILDGFESGGLSGAASAAASVAAETIDTLASEIGNNLHSVLEQGEEILVSLSEGISESIPELASAATDVVVGIMDFLSEEGPGLLDAGGEILENIISGIIGAVSGIWKSLPEIITAIVSFFGENLPALAETGGELLGNIVIGLIAEIPTLIASLPEILTAIGEGFNTLNDTVVEIGASLLDGIISGLIEGIEDELPGIREGFQQVWDAITEVFAGADTWLDEKFSAAADGMRAAMDGLDEFFAGLWDDITDVFSEVGEWFSETFTEAWELIQEAWESVVDWFTEIWESIVEVYSVVATWFSDMFTSAWNGIQAAWATVVEWFTGIWNSIVEVYSVVSTWFSETFTAAWEAIQEAWSTVVEWFTGIWNSIAEAFEGAADWFGEKFAAALESIQEAWSGITEYFSGVWEDIQGVFSDAIDVFFDIGGNIVKGIKDGIADAWDSLVSWVTDKIGDIVDSVEDCLGIDSPSKVFAEIGGYMAQGLGEGWENDIANVKDNIDSDLDYGTSTVDSAASALGTALTASGGKGVTVIQNIYSQAQTAADIFREARWEQERAVLSGVYG